MQRQGVTNTVQADFRQLPLCLVSFFVELRMICKGLPKHLLRCLEVGCWST